MGKWVLLRTNFDFSTGLSKCLQLKRVHGASMEVFLEYTAVFICLYIELST